MSRPSPVPPSPLAAGRAVSLVLRHVRKAYDVGPVARPRRHVVLRDLSLWVDEGDCLLLHGGGAGPLTLLRCAAGLVVPDEGDVVWRGRDGRRAPPPPRALVGADWRPAARCLTALDVLQAAVPSGLTQPEADRRVEAAARACALRPLLDHRAADLPSPCRWRVGVAAALVEGAAWLLLEMPAAAPASRAGTSAAGAVLGALHARRSTLIVSAPPGWAPVLPTGRVLHWRDGRAWLAPIRRAVADAGRRVAEPGCAPPPPLTLARAPL